MANANQNSKTKIYRENIDWQNLGLAALTLAALIAAIGYFRGPDVFKAEQPKNPAPRQDLPENFESKALPRKISCWRVKLKPNEFSGKVILPENIGFTLRWQTSQLVQIRNGYGEILTIDPRIQNHLGKHEGNLVLQFKGHGAVLIVITECL